MAGSRRRPSKAALEAVRATVALAEEARRAAELDRERQRLERIGELVEQVFATAERAESGWATDWMTPRNRLAQALVGRREEFQRAQRSPGKPAPDWPR